MKNFLIFFFVLILSSPAYAVTAVLYDPNDTTVPGRVSKYGKVSSTSSAPVNSLVLDSPTIDDTPAEAIQKSANLATFNSLRSGNIKANYWKVVNGVLSELSIQEKVDADAADQILSNAVLSSQIDALNVSIEDYLLAYTKVLKTQVEKFLKDYTIELKTRTDTAYSGTLNISAMTAAFDITTMKSDVIDQIKTDKGL